MKTNANLGIVAPKLITYEGCSKMLLYIDSAPEGHILQGTPKSSGYGAIGISLGTCDVYMF